MTAEVQYIIVGSGVASSTIAKRLLEFDHNTSILMLEAGPEIKDKDRRSWWDFVVSGARPYKKTYDRPDETESAGSQEWDFYENRVIAYGGSTMHWGGWSLRFKPEDFELLSRTGNPKASVKDREGADWPITYNDMERYYCEAEEYLSVCGDDSEDWGIPRTQRYLLPPYSWTEADGEMIEAFRKLNIKPGKMPIARYRKCMTTGTCKYCPFGSRFSSQHIVDELRSDVRYRRFRVQSLAAVSEIITDSKKLITGIKYRDLATNEEHKIYASTVIVCSGSYEVPKLLKRSRSSFWPNGIGNDNDLVGRFIVSHSMLKVRGEKKSNKERWIQELDFPTLMSRTFDTPEYQEKGKLFIFKDRTVPHTNFADLMCKGKTRAEIDALLTNSRQMEIQAFIEEKGRFHSFVEEMEGTTHMGLPKTRVHFNRTPQDHQNSNQHLDRLREIIKTMGYEIVDGTDRVQSPGGHHATSTCRMSQTPDDGVTDINLLVHGTDNLYVCSNAVLPTCSAVNPTLTLTAIAMRLSDHLIGLAKPKRSTVGAVSAGTKG